MAHTLTLVDADLSAPHKPWSIHNGGGGGGWWVVVVVQLTVMSAFQYPDNSCTPPSRASRNSLRTRTPLTLARGVTSLNPATPESVRNVENKNARDSLGKLTVLIDRGDCTIWRELQK